MAKTTGGDTKGEHLAAHREDHTPQAVRSRLDSGPNHSYLRDFIYGAIDGAVTTFAVVSGVAGAQLSETVVIVLGIANLIADGFSMAVGNYLGTRADVQTRELAREEEERHINIFPDGEREEVRQIFLRKGFSGKELERVVDVITSDVKRWVDTMIQEELGLSLESPSPIRAAITTFIAFVLIGSIPLATYLLNALFPGLIARPFFWSLCFTGIAFFIVGTFKSRFVRQSWLSAGVETLCIGGIAAVLAYYIGIALRGFA